MSSGRSGITPQPNQTDNLEYLQVYTMQQKNKSVHADKTTLRVNLEAYQRFHRTAATINRHATVTLDRCLNYMAERPSLLLEIADTHEMVVNDE